jgi:hypothetical protein
MIEEGGRAACHSDLVDSETARVKQVERLDPVTLEPLTAP